MHRIERFTHGALRRGGIEGSRLHLLLDDVTHGSARSLRALERAIGAEIGKVFEEEPPRKLDRRGQKHRAYVLSARIRLGHGVHWNHDTLECKMPSLLQEQAVGRRLGEVLSHPDAPIDCMTLPPRMQGGLVSINDDPICTVTPSAGARAAHMIYRARLLHDEMRLDAPLHPKARAVHLALTLVTICIALVHFVMMEEDVVGWIVMTMLILSSGVGMVNIANATLRRPYSLLHAMMAEERHRRFLESQKQGENS